MKIGLISDVHGNILALEKVLNRFEELDVEKILCTGDLIGIGPHSEDVVQLIKSKENIVCVRGNHEGYLLDGIPKVIHGRPMDEVETAHHTWIHNGLSKDSIEFLNALPKVQNVDVLGKKIYMAHYPISKFGIYKKFIKLPTLEESRELFEDVDVDICIYGHTHVFSKNIDEKKLYLNLDALGCPQATENAMVGILDILDENVEYTRLSVPYDAEKVRDDIKRLKYPFYNGVLKIFYGE